MIKRVIEISHRSHCAAKQGQLQVIQGEQTNSIPIEDMGVLILNSPQSTYSHASLAQCVEQNVNVILCNEKHLPCGMFLPLDCNTLQSKYMALHLGVATPTKKRLWQSIIRAKLRAQARLLEEVNGKGGQLAAMAGRVRSGDPDNYEAQGARYYWKSLYGSEFRRVHRGGRGINGLLNYGYAIIRASLARAIVAVGLHPSFGIHHHNQNNAFCLVDDLIEPIRPLVDRTVYHISRTAPVSDELSPQVKVQILSLLSQRVRMDKKSNPLMIAFHHYATSLRGVYAKEQTRLQIPQV